MSSCSSTCTATCTSTCSGTSSGTSTTCSSTCTATCTSTCSGTSSGTSTTCSSTCTATCTSTCSGTSSGTSTTCSSTCTATCTSTCSGTSSGTSTTCSSTCTATCTSTCSGTSSGTSTTCSSTCTATCTSTCSGTSSGTSTTCSDCTSTCASNCSGSSVISLGLPTINGIPSSSVEAGESFTISGSWPNSDHIAIAIDNTHWTESDGEDFSRDISLTEAGEHVIVISARNTPSSSDYGTDYDSKTYTVNVIKTSNGKWRIEINIPEGADTPGILKLYDANGTNHFTCGCLGRGSSDVVPSDNHRDWWRTNADTPTGEWDAKLGGFGDSQSSYGPYKKIILTAIEGNGDNADIACCNNSPYASRDLIRIHGGDTTSGLPWSPYRPTHGCIRVLNSDQLSLQTYLESGNFSGNGTAIISGIQKERTLPL